MKKCGKLTILGDHFNVKFGNSKYSRQYIVAECECGVIKCMREDGILGGDTLSCGECRTIRTNKGLKHKKTISNITYFVGPVRSGRRLVTAENMGSSPIRSAFMRNKDKYLSNRQKRLEPRLGIFWCEKCDANLVSRGGKCSYCKRKTRTRRLKK